MTFTVGMSRPFADEFAKYPPDQRAKIRAFIRQFEQIGLKGKFDAYEGKITYSWNKVPLTDPMHAYAKGNELWHYHIGIPEFKPGMGPYKVSEMVLHFQWPGQGDHIDLVDLYDHYDYDGNFWLPPQANLANVIVTRQPRPSLFEYLKKKLGGP